MINKRRMSSSNKVLKEISPAPRGTATRQESICSLFSLFIDLYSLCLYRDDMYEAFADDASHPPVSMWVYICMYVMNVSTPQIYFRVLVQCSSLLSSFATVLSPAPQSTPLYGRFSKTMDR